MTALYDPTDPAVQEEPYPIYRELRDRYPVHYNDDIGFWALSRFEDVWAATRDPSTFANDPRHLKHRPPTLGRLLPESSMDFGLFYMDPPEHNRVRALISLAFTPKRTAELASSIRQICRALLAPLAMVEKFDLVREFSSPLPMAVIGALMDVPTDERDHIAQLWREIVERPELADADEVERRVAAAIGEIFSVYRAVVHRRRRRPGTDLVSALTQAELDGATLNDDQIISICYQLNVAGNDTTAHLISHAVVHLLRQRWALRALSENPSAVPDALEEVLRLESPSPVGPRFTTRDVVLPAGTIPANSLVTLVYGAANRYEREFTDPDHLNLGRDAPRHLAFGHGTHFCLGAHLARLEACIALEEIIPLLDGLELAGEPRRLRSPFIRGIVGLELARP